jgi:hypothetical protein
MTVEQAVHAFTLGNAYAANREAHLGSIAPGKLADLVVLSDDIFQIEPMRIAQTTAVATFLDGQPVHRSGEFPS